MNITELRYIVAIARYGSVSAAAKAIYVAQPNLSKAIKTLEEEYGIRLFERSTTGMVPTEEGQRFVSQARKILEEIAKLDMELTEERKFSAELRVAIPRASYASHAAVAYINQIADRSDINVQIRECSSTDAVNNVIRSNYHLAVIRYDRNDDDACTSMLRMKGLEFEPLLDFQYNLLTSRSGILAGREFESAADLEGCIEILHGDVKLPNGQPLDMVKEPQNVKGSKKVYVYERGIQFDLLCDVKNSYMWVSPMPEEILERFGLVQKKCPFQKRQMRDIIVYPGKVFLRREDREFIRELKREAEKVSG